MNTLHFSQTVAHSSFRAFLLAVLCFANAPLFGQGQVCQNRVDWTTMPSKYTHDAQGQRVDQYAQAVEPISNERSDFERSGYRQYRSTLQAGNSADNLHIVEQWGRPVRPYEEWRFPNRPYAVPYSQWGPQPPAVGIYPYGAGPFGAGIGPYGPGVGFGPGPGGAGGGGGAGMGGGAGGFPPGYQPWQGNYNGYPSPYVPNPQAPWINGYWQPPVEPSMSDREFFQIPRP